MPSELLKERFHALDGLRAIMMLLGIVLHASLPYATWTFSVYSAYHDSAHTIILSGVAFLIHLFRMPVFFIIAGFFGSLLWHTHGARAFVQNRLKRVLLPLGLSWVVLFPLTVLSAAFTMLGGPSGIARVVQQLHSGALLAQNNLTFYQLLTQLGLIHLWFLYFLILFCGTVAVLLLGVQRLPLKTKHWLDTSSPHMLRSAGVLLLPAITWLTMLPMRPAHQDTTGIEGTNAFLPAPAILLTHFVFFIFGWLLFRHKHLLSVFAKKAWIYTGLGLGAAGLYALLILQAVGPTAHFIQVAAAAPAIWLLSLGSIGLATRYFGQPTGFYQYLSEASYWVYLVHLPFTLLLPGLLIDLPLPALLKFLLVCIGTTGISLLTYRYWVRTTRLGSLLNGRRRAPYSLLGLFRKPATATPQTGSAF